MSVLIDGYEIDVAVEESHQLESRTTPYPVEDGSSAVDHVEVLPDRVTLVGIVSDTPLYVTRPDGSIPSLDAWARLRLIRSSRRRVEIETSLGTYTNMVLISLQAPRDNSIGDALRFRATFEQVEILSVREVTITFPRAAKSANRGLKASKPAPELAPSPTESTKVRAGTLWNMFN